MAKLTKKKRRLLFVRGQVHRHNTMKKNNKKMRRAKKKSTKGSGGTAGSNKSLPLSVDAAALQQKLDDAWTGVNTMGDGMRSGDTVVAHGLTTARGREINGKRGIIAADQSGQLEGRLAVEFTQKGPAVGASLVTAVRSLPAKRLVLYRLHGVKQNKDAVLAALRAGDDGGLTMEPVRLLQPRTPTPSPHP